MLHQSGKKPAAVKTAGRFSEKLSVNPFANTGSDAETAKGGKAARSLYTLWQSAWQYGGSGGVYFITGNGRSGIACSSVILCYGED